MRIGVQEFFSEFAQENWGAMEMVLSFDIGEKGIEELDEMGKYDKREAQGMIRNLRSSDVNFDVDSMCHNLTAKHWST